MSEPPPRTLEDARRLVEAQVDIDYGRGNVVVPADNAQEHPFGWVFFPLSARFVETGDFGDTLDGLGPAVVERVNGKITFLSTSMPPAVAVDVFRRAWDAREAQNRG